MGTTDSRYRLVGRTLRNYDLLSSKERARISAILKSIPPDVGSVLDIGCGEGTITNQAIERGRSVIGVDISRISLANVEVPSVQATLGSLPFASSSIDLVICASVLEHLECSELPGAAEEIERVASHYMLISTPYKEPLWKNLTRCPECNSIYHKNLHLHVFDEGKIIDLFKRSDPVLIRYGSREPYRLGLLIWIANRLLNLYSYPENPIQCPVCKVVFSRSSRPSAAKRAGSGMIGVRIWLGRAIGRLIGSLPIQSARNPSHIVMLLEKRDGS